MDRLKGIFDQYDDNGQLLRKEFAGKPIPAIIKTAANLTDATVKNPGDYALSLTTEFGNEYRYPVLDAGNTVTSAVYFSKYGLALPEELREETAGKLTKALVSFGFTPPEDFTKTASMALGYSGAADDMSLEKLFGLGDEDSDLEVIEDAFHGLSPKGKRRLMLKVKEAGMLDKVASKMTSYASDEIGSDFPMAIDTRKLAVLEPEAIIELDKLASSVDSADPSELAEKLSEYDIKYGISHLYNKVIPDPYASVFGTSIEKAASTVSPLEINGHLYRPDEIEDWFQHGGEGKLAETFDDDFVAQFSSDPSGVLDSLPITHKNIIANMIKGD